jgi:hypothetical protein
MQCRDSISYKLKRAMESCSGMHAGTNLGGRALCQQLTTVSQNTLQKAA